MDEEMLNTSNCGLTEGTVHERRRSLCKERAAGKAVSDEDPSFMIARSWKGIKNEEIIDD